MHRRPFVFADRVRAQHTTHTRHCLCGTEVPFQYSLAFHVGPLCTFDSCGARLERAVVGGCKRGECRLIDLY